MISCLKNYIDLTRLNKPIGIWLLFLPCLFGIALAYKFNHNFDLAYLVLLMFTGAVLTRSAGCIINDILDCNFDSAVERTKNRPITSGAIATFQATIFLIILLLAALVILLQFNRLTILLGFIALLLVIIYPTAKRFTHYPQIFLGITFNWGILIAGGAILEKITPPFILLYCSALIWTVIYDTIYAYQDLEDDLKIGVKSTAVKFGKNPQKILYQLTAFYLLLLILVGIAANLKFAYYPAVLLAVSHLVCQIKSCDFSSSKSCLKNFKSNVWVGIIILIAIILG